VKFKIILLVIVRPSNDLAMSSVVYPFDGECADGSQYVTIKLRNSGSKEQRNIPLSVDILENGNPLSTLSGVFNGPLVAGAESEYTFQTPFVMKANANIYLHSKIKFGDRSKCRKQPGCFRSKCISSRCCTYSTTSNDL